MATPRTPRPVHSERLVVMLTEEQLFLIERAAELAGTSVSGLVRLVGVARAKEIIARESGVDSSHVARPPRR